MYKGRWLLGALLSAAIATPGIAQQFPTRPITFVGFTRNATDCA